MTDLYRASEVIAKFTFEIKNLNDTDYGDFMRKANSRLMDLSHDLTEHGQEQTRMAIQNIQLYLQHRPNWDIETTKTRILKDAMVLYHSLGHVH